MTVQAALAGAMARLAAAGVDTPRLDAQLLLIWVLKARREDLARAPERLLSAREILIFDKAVSLRVLRRPLPYITGEQWFYGRAFKINRAVLIPRPETEILVEAILEACVLIEAPRVADIGTGSGCIAVTTACELPTAQVWATDLSNEALTLARKNVVRYGLSERVTLAQGDLLTPLPPKSRWDVIVSNPPYITEDELENLQPEVRDYEPRLALSGSLNATGAHGDTLHRRLLERARLLLKPDGWVLLEVGKGQAERIMDYARMLEYEDVDARPDLGGILRVVRAHGRKNP